MKTLGLTMLVACSGAAPPVAHPDAVHAPLSLAADARMVTVRDGRYIAGSTREERDGAYDDYLQSSGADTARENKWFDHERDRTQLALTTFRIDLMPVTQAQYAEFVSRGGARAPSIDEAAWSAQGFAQPFATEVARFNWTDGRPPNGREDHPVVLVSWTDAAAYCTWRGTMAGQPRRLPTADEHEKAARGDRGILYPWGNTFEPAKLNSGVGGPRDTVPAGSISAGESPYGLLDLAGNVFQWTSTPFETQLNKMTVKGSSWEDFAGVGRGASQHGRAKSARHVIVGFRCAASN